VKEPYFKPWKGKNYRATKFLILSESAYSWPSEDGKVHTPRRSHPKDSVLWSFEASGKVPQYFTRMSWALCGTKTPTPRQRKEAWNDYAFTIFVQRSVGLSAASKHTRKQFEDAGPHFLALIEKIRPLKVIVTGKDLWNGMPDTAVTRRGRGAYRLSDGTLVWCLAVPHPANRTEGFNWKRVSKSILRFRSAKLPLRN
jgi:hypothetical protein